MHLSPPMVSPDPLVDPGSSLAVAMPSTSVEAIHPDHPPHLSLRSLTAAGRSAVVSASAQFSPRLTSLVYPLGRHVVMPLYFGAIEVTGRENLLHCHGPLILAPTHRSRWDALMVPYAAGYDVIGQHLRFMVSADEVTGLQGWLIRRMGGFPINTNRPAIASLRYGVDLLQKGEVLVIFPEGDIFRDKNIQPLKPGLARLALQAEASQANLGIQIVPMHLDYSQPLVPWRCRVKVQIGQPLRVPDYDLASPKHAAQQLTEDLQQALHTLNIP